VVLTVEQGSAATFLGGSLPGGVERVRQASWAASKAGKFHEILKAKSGVEITP